MVDDKVRIRCSKCTHVFREKAQRVRPGFECHCKSCQRMIIFDIGSENPDIRRALRSAKEIRLAIEAAAEAAAATAARPKQPLLRS